MNTFLSPLSLERETECLKKVAQNDKEAKDELILHNMRLVAHVTKKYAVSEDEMEELISIGTIGLIKAVSSFKADYGNRFATFAIRCIENEILMHFRSRKKSRGDVTFYWPSSPSSGGNFKDPDSDDVGDRHYWDVWHGEKPFSDYENYYFRFCSEFGFQSFPCKKTIDTFTLPKDRNIFSEVMESHQKNGSANAKILHYIAENFLYPKDFESLIYISQVLQAIAIKSGVEHWRRNRGRCMGAIYWQLNDNWPVASWASIDYFGRWKALQYFSRHFYADVLGSLKVSADAVYTPYLQNETMQEVSSDVTVFVKNMRGEVLFETSQRTECAPLSVEAMEPVSLKEVIEGRESEVFVEAVFTHSDGTVSRQVEMPKPYKHMQIEKAEITFDAKREGNLLTLQLKSDVPAFFVSVESDVDLVWSDNFMHLTGKEPYEIMAILPECVEGMPKIWVRSLCDSWVTDYSQA